LPPTTIKEFYTKVNTKFQLGIKLFNPASNYVGTISLERGDDSLYLNISEKTEDCAKLWAFSRRAGKCKPIEEKH